MKNLLCSLFSHKVVDISHCILYLCKQHAQGDYTWLSNDFCSTWQRLEHAVRLHLVSCQKKHPCIKCTYRFAHKQVDCDWILMQNDVDTLSSYGFSGAQRC